jgi:CubicO group peptidase (beta-lactamase class C family)
VSGETYPDHVQRALFEPHGLTQTMYCGQREIIMHRTEGYMVENGRVFNAAPLSMGPPGAAGALCSTPRDLVRWTRALHAGRVVSPASFTTMTTPTRLADGTTNPYGYGLTRGSIGDIEAIQHSGGINGFSAYLAHYPSQELTVVVIANGPTNTGAVSGRIARAVLGLPEPVGR